MAPFPAPGSMAKIQEISLPPPTATTMRPSPPYFTPDPTAAVVPTPALLPGLVGIGIAAIRKRKQAVAVSKDA